MSKLIFGKQEQERIVSCEISGNTTEIFTEELDGTIKSHIKPNKFWLLAPKKLDEHFKMLKGDLYYSYMKTYDDKEHFLRDKSRYYRNDCYMIYDEKEAAMTAFGFTYFKGMKVNEISVLAFDIESTGLEHNKDSKVLLISNTYRKNGKIIRKLFAYDDYETEAELFDSWCKWVREVNPSVMIGHNIYSYDLPYINFCARRAGTELVLGRDNSNILFDERESKFRKDASQFYTYHKAYVYGREIVDTLFLSIKYDIGRKYESYRLKKIIQQENLEIQGRQHYDAENINKTYKIPSEWIKIKKYAEHDADDSLALFDLMVPSYFYLTQSIPKTFQQIINSASGSQINSLLVRSYLQDGHSIPKPSDGQEYEGGISFGVPGVYKNVFKVDVASLYPSIILQWDIYDKVKDPKGHFLKMVEHFTEERLANKKLGKETNDKYYKDLEQAQKIVINSAYGMLAAQGLNFNSPWNAAFITRKGRDILQGSIDWAKINEFTVPNADTDSISVCKIDMTDISVEERKGILQDINSQFPEKIKFEDDGYFKSVLVIRAKNYVLQTFDGKKKTKGSSLKATLKEVALKEFIDKSLDNLLNSRQEEILRDYQGLVKEIHHITDITRWCSKKTITSKVLDPQRSNEEKVLAAIKDTDYREGDKVYMYYHIDDSLKLREHWNNDHNIPRLLKKLYNTLECFETVLDMSKYPNYDLKRNSVLLDIVVNKELTEQELIELIANPPKPIRKKKTIALAPELEDNRTLENGWEWTVSDNVQAK